MSEHNDRNINSPIADELLELSEQIRAETGVDLLQKSPQTLSQLLIADAISDASLTLDKIADGINCMPLSSVSDHEISEMSNGVYKGLNSIAKAIDSQSKRELSTADSCALSVASWADCDAAFSDVHIEISDCFREAVLSFYAVSTEGREADQLDFQAKLEFASKHCQLFSTYFSVHFLEYKKRMRDMRASGSVNDG